MKELSLFTGAGGGLLGTHLLGWEPIGYVEWNEYCQKVIAARIGDGYLPSAPIFTDVREFVQSGAAEQYRGFADVVTAGFPCQPFSVAGKQLAAGDDRNMWPATRDVIRIIRPHYIVLENVPGLLSCGYAGTVIGDLAALGYVGKWGCISASSIGAKHQRRRWWVVAHSASKGCKNATWGRPFRRISWDRSASGSGCEERVLGQRKSCPTSDSLEPGVGRVAYGLAFGMDRLKALGNGQVPAVVRAAWELMS